MTRPLRIEFPGAFYHITARGNEKRNIFRENHDKEKLLSYFEELHRRYGIIIYTYCLMDNHYHLLLQTPQGNISKVMHDLNSRYTLYFNKRYKRTGHLFQGRYGGILIDEDNYLLTVSRYIHLNPVRAKIVKNPEDYPDSSIAYFLTEKKAPPWFNSEFILKQFSNNITEAKKIYKEFLYSGIKNPQDPFKDVFAQSILGKQEFVEKMKKRLSKNIPQPTAGIAYQKKINRTIELKDIEEQICQYYNIEKSILFKPKKNNTAFKIFVYFSRQYTNVSLDYLKKYLRRRIADSTISKTVARLKAIMAENTQLREDISRLEKMITLNK